MICDMCGWCVGLCGVGLRYARLRYARLRYARLRGGRAARGVCYLKQEPNIEECWEQEKHIVCQRPIKF